MGDQGRTVFWLILGLALELVVGRTAASRCWSDAIWSTGSQRRSSAVTSPAGCRSPPRPNCSPRCDRDRAVALVRTPSARTLRAWGETFGYVARLPYVANMRAGCSGVAF